ncbi:la-related protein 1B-like [Arachis stenosperma]|uniref:la-related protein 1B-like n=1 Tax=Arachis stenosperma TaxID=217475 RepID=UPI0025AD5403|nr:la-related protein 1B-like [Arachis stenosperma]
MAMAGNHSAVSPWNQVVRGGESESVLAAPSSAMESAVAVESSLPSGSTAVSTSLSVEDSCSTAESSKNGGNKGRAAKKPAWNKPSSNGGASEVKLVMDAVSWPALSESTRVAIKSESSSKGLLDGSSSSVLQSQGMGSSSSSQRQVNDNASANHMVPSPNRQKPFKHNSPNVFSNGGHPQPPASQALTATTGSHYQPPIEHAQRSAFVSNDRPQQRNSFRNRNSGSHQRGDGSHHHNYGNRRDQDWNTQRNFNGRDPHMPPRVGPRFPRPPPPPPNAPQFIHTAPVRAFGGPIGFHDVVPPIVYLQQPPSHPNLLRGVHYGPPMPPQTLFYTGPDPQLHTRIVTQINYYFSNENLIKDTFLRQNMDDQGWVPIRLIAGFNKVMHLTDNIQVILDAVRSSSVVEVQGDKIRRRNDWKRWIIPPTVQFPNTADSSIQGTVNQDSLSERVQNFTLRTSNHDGTRELDAHTDLSEHTLGEFNNPLQFSNSQSTGQSGIQGADHPVSAGN